MTRLPFRKRMKFRFRRWIMMLGQRTVGSDLTLAWASRLGWIGSYDQKTWYMRGDDGKERT